MRRVQVPLCLILAFAGELLPVWRRAIKWTKEGVAYHKISFLRSTLQVPILFR